jgi:MoxR-like ATPase
MDNNLFENRVDLKALNETADKLRAQMAKVIVGQQKMIDAILVAILSNGHVLIEGVPGIAKTLTVKLIAKSISAIFSRIQFTPDLMPSDVLGTTVFNLATSQFDFNKGPIFGNLILIDEINRAPAKTQSALFEVMEERQITIDSKTYLMQPPFIVFATQNPIEQEGTYRLPEAQLDRFLFKINVKYPSLEEEIVLLKNKNAFKGKNELESIEAVLSTQQITEYQKIVKNIVVEEHLLTYIAQIINKTRTNPWLYLGASPRASIAILDSAKAFAAINGRDFVTPEDIKEMAYPVMRHRIILSPEKEMEEISADEIIKQIINSVEVPR